MLQQQHVVVIDPAEAAALVDGALQVPPLLIGESPEPARPQQRHTSSCSQSQVSSAVLMWLRKRTAVEPSNAR